MRSLLLRDINDSSGSLDQCQASPPERNEDSTKAFITEIRALEARVKALEAESAKDKAEISSLTAMLEESLSSRQLELQELREKLSLEEFKVLEVYSQEYTSREERISEEKAYQQAIHEVQLASVTETSQAHLSVLETFLQALLVAQGLRLESSVDLPGGLQLSPSMDSYLLRSLVPKVRESDLMSVQPTMHNANTYTGIL